MRLVTACWRANSTACSAVPTMSVTRNCGGFGTGGIQQFGQDAIDLHRFLLGVFDDLAGDAGLGQVAAHDVEHAGNARQRVANLVRQPCRQFSQRCEVFGARHLRLVQSVDLFAAGLQLRHHVVEVAAQIADFVIAIGKADSHVHVAQLDARNLLLQLDHGAAHLHRQHHDHGYANDECAAGRYRDHVAARSGSE